MLNYKSIQKALINISADIIEETTVIENQDGYFACDETIKFQLEIPYASTEGKWKFEITDIETSVASIGETEEIVIVESDKDEKDIAMELFAALSDYLVNNGYSKELLYCIKNGFTLVTLDQDVYKAGQSESEYNSASF